jgi:hypothetical protein
VAVVESPAGPGEEERREVGVRVAQALSLRGLAVITLGQLESGWAFEKSEGALGPGALAVEARLGLPLFPLALSLLCGQPLRLEGVPRGFAFATRLPSSAIGSIYSLRIEVGLDGSAYVCAHAPDAGQAERRLTRALSGAR